MVADSSKAADPPKRKRRWFQFSLRALLVGVMLIAFGGERLLRSD
jgi:hypothetical protein